MILLSDFNHMKFICDKKYVFKIDYVFHVIAIGVLENGGGGGKSPLPPSPGRNTINNFNFMVVLHHMYEKKSIILPGTPF